jgi:hypothetical protein
MHPLGALPADGQKGLSSCQTLLALAEECNMLCMQWDSSTYPWSEEQVILESLV